MLSFNQRDLTFSKHALERMSQRNIFFGEDIDVLLNSGTTWEIEREYEGEFKPYKVFQVPPNRLVIALDTDPPTVTTLAGWEEKEWERELGSGTLYGGRYQ